MDENKQNTTKSASLPEFARLPINRCNLPAVILGSLTFQQHPVPLLLDGVNELHRQIFTDLDGIDDAGVRAIHFMDYMRSGFLLDNPELAGMQMAQQRCRREKADYLKLLRGWLFNPDSKEAAVLKSWVESRFGLLPRNHHGPLGDFSRPNYQMYLSDCAKGLYNSNALESQLDLLYAFCQYELARQRPAQSHALLYRGTNNIDEYESLSGRASDSMTLLLNSLNSFTSTRERADEFGDTILQAEVPLCKLLYFPALIPGILQSEDEYLVIGGVYRVTIDRSP